MKHFSLLFNHHDMVRQSLHRARHILQQLQKMRRGAVENALLFFHQGRMFRRRHGLVHQIQAVAIRILALLDASGDEL